MPFGRSGGYRGGRQKEILGLHLSLMSDRLNHRIRAFAVSFPFRLGRVTGGGCSQCRVPRFWPRGGGCGANGITGLKPNRGITMKHKERQARYRTEIFTALFCLNHMRDEHWSADGSPKFTEIVSRVESEDLMMIVFIVQRDFPWFTREFAKREDVVQMREDIVGHLIR